MAEAHADELRKQIGTIQQGMPWKTIDVRADDQLGGGHGFGLRSVRGIAQVTSVPETQCEIRGFGELKLVSGGRAAVGEELPTGFIERETRLPEDFLPAVVFRGIFIGLCGSGAHCLGDVRMAEVGLEIGGETLRSRGEGAVA